MSEEKIFGLGITGAVTIIGSIIAWIKIHPAAIILPLVLGAILLYLIYTDFAKIKSWWAGTGAAAAHHGPGTPPTSGWETAAKWLALIVFLLAVALLLIKLFFQNIVEKLPEAGKAIAKFLLQPEVILAVFVIALVLFLAKAIVGWMMASIATIIAVAAVLALIGLLIWGLYTFGRNQMWWGNQAVAKAPAKTKPTSRKPASRGRRYHRALPPKHRTHHSRRRRRGSRVVYCDFVYKSGHVDSWQCGDGSKVVVCTFSMYNNGTKPTATSPSYPIKGTCDGATYQKDGSVDVSDGLHTVTYLSAK